MFSFSTDFILIWTVHIVLWQVFCFCFVQNYTVSDSEEKPQVFASKMFPRNQLQNKIVYFQTIGIKLIPKLHGHGVIYCKHMGKVRVRAGGLVKSHLKQGSVLHNVYIVQFFSSRPNEVRHILKSHNCHNIEHIFVL